jgi:hypothetical protein
MAVVVSVSGPVLFATKVRAEDAPESHARTINLAAATGESEADIREKCKGWGDS